MAALFFFDVKLFTWTKVFLSIALEGTQHLPKQSVCPHGREQCFWVWEKLLHPMLQGVEALRLKSCWHQKMSRVAQEAEVSGEVLRMTLRRTWLFFALVLWVVLAIVAWACSLPVPFARQIWRWTCGTCQCDDYPKKQGLDFLAWGLAPKIDEAERLWLG